MRYEYKVIAGEIGNAGGRGAMPDPHSLTVHHSAVIRNGSEDPKTVAASYCKYHGGYMPYHFLIPYNDDNNIYVTQYVSQYTWHNSNGIGNKDSLAICIDGNFQEQQPKETQLKKFKQLLDDFNSDWFKQNGWSSALDGIRPKQKDVWTYSDNKKVFTLHWHNEVAQIGHGTACCGKNLMPYVSEYRDKAGSVSWGQPVTPPAKPEDQAVWDWANLYREDVTKVFTIDTVVKGWWYPYSPIEVTAMHHAMAQQVSHLSEQLSTTNAKLVSQGVELTEAQNANKLLVAENKSKQNTIDKLNNDIDLMKVGHQTIVDGKDAIIDELNKKITGLKNIVEEQQDRIDNLMKENEDLKKENQELKEGVVDGLSNFIQRIFNLFKKDK